MKCKNCSSEESYLDDRMGEEVCRDCGYVMVTNILEDRVNVSLLENQLWTASRESHQHYSRTADRGVLGSVIEKKGYSGSYINRLMKTQKMFKGKQEVSLSRGYLEINMVLSPYLPNQQLKERAHHYYKKLFFERTMIGYNIDVRACAVSLIVLRENGIPITIADLAKANNLNAAKVSKCARKFARILGKPYILHSMPISAWSEKVLYDLITNKYGDMTLKKSFRQDAKAVIEYIHQNVTAMDITFTKSYMASALWIAICLRSYGSHAEFTQHDVGAVCNCTPVSLRTRNKETFKMFNITKESLDKLNVKQFIAGVRYE